MSSLATAVPAAGPSGRTDVVPDRGPRPAAGLRPRVDGKYLFVGDEKLLVRGVTYGTFRVGDGVETGYDAATAEADLAAMAAAGVNALRVYDLPPAWLLDVALRHGLWVLVGLPWEQHVTFLDQRRVRRAIEERVRSAVRACAGHPAVLAYAVGNEIPSPVVRWHGARRVEAFLERLAGIVRAEDPGALVTYVNYPTTEYLQTPFVDFVAANVYLEDPDRFAAYIAHLQTLAGDRAVVIAELGLDSRAHGEAAQAALVETQVRSAFALGVSGSFVFAWTDEWVRGGADVVDWDFGLVHRDRSAKPALAAISRAYAELPFPRDGAWPRISVVVCSYNGQRSLDWCLEGLDRLDYPDYEVIVIDDGSTDRTPEIARAHPVRLVSQPNRGLSAARNEGLALATGEIVAYTDDDARPERDWLRFIAAAYRDPWIGGAGGPNIPPPTTERGSDLVADAPGGPLHVLRSDLDAEHIPGCNSTFRVDALRAIGGYDTRFRVAGDDVDVSWRLREAGHAIAFSPGAMVWHLRRPSLRTYLKQQRGYGRAEALLAGKWPGRFNALGHVTWPGQLYGGMRYASPWPEPAAYHGTWGTAPYQSLYDRGRGAALWPQMPEWVLGTVALGALGLLGITWPPLLWLLALALAGVTLTWLSAFASARAAVRARPAGVAYGRGGRTAWLTLLFAIQPLARLRGRLSAGLTPWRWHGPKRLGLPLPRRVDAWREEWRSIEDDLGDLETRARALGVAVRRGGPFDRWDVEVRTGTLGSTRLLAMTEEHGHGRRMVRFRSRPFMGRAAVALVVAPAGLALWAASAGAALAAIVLGLVAAALVIRVLLDLSASAGALDAGLSGGGS